VYKPKWISFGEVDKLVILTEFVWGYRAKPKRGEWEVHLYITIPPGEIDSIIMNNAVFDSFEKAFKGESKS